MLDTRLLFNKKKIQSFFTYKIDFESQNLPFLTNFTQLTARLKNFLIGRLLGWHQKECLEECTKVFDKSVVILLRVTELKIRLLEEGSALTGIGKGLFLGRSIPRSPAFMLL